MDGWGIGYFKNHHAFVEKSAERIYVPGRVHDSFQRLARVVRSRIILSHVRLQTSGPVDECHAHPFILRFCGHEWIFAHNGKAPAIESYRAEGAAIDGAVSDSARAFEYLRDHLVSAYRSGPALSPLFEVLRQGTAKMMEEYPGNYNYLLTNGWILFAFTNHRQFMLLKGSRELEGALLLTTLEQGLSDERWLRLARPSNARGLLLAISGADIVLHRSL
jgi:predicted glutamine amidotransferase